MQRISPVDPLCNAAVVFLHGIFGRFYRTWATFPEVLQARRDPTVQSYEFYLFKYTTSLIHQPSILDEPLKTLDRFFESVRSKYDTVVLIGHSQGGILAKLYIIQKLLNGEGTQLKVDLVITCHTPHQGIALCNIPLALRQIPLLKSLVQCHQLCELGSWSSVMRKLKQNWGPPLIRNEPCDPGPAHRYVRSITLAGNDWIVWKHNARGFPVDTFDERIERGRGHSLSPKKLEALFKLYLEEHGSPATLLREIRRLQEDSIEKAAFINRNGHKVRSILQNAFPLLDESDLPKAVTFAVGIFLEEFPLHPLRGLSTLDEALQKYLSRKAAAICGRSLVAPVA